MSPRPTALLGLVFCLGQMTHMHEGALPKPSISAEPGPVVPRGQPVTIVCRGPDRVDIFRLENGRYSVLDQTVVSQPGSLGTEATFHLPAASEDTASSYRCRYRKGGAWSERSEPLELKVTGPPCESTAPPPGAGSQPAPASWDYTVGNCVRIGLAGVVLLILVAILAEAGHSQRKSPHGPQG